MIINMQKQPGGMLVPASDEDADRLQKFKSGEWYPVEIKRARNPAFHRKVFAFFNFCFEHWKSDREFMDEPGQKNVFRKHLTVLAGYYDSYYGIDGSVRVEAKSLSYANMEQQEFEEFYSALIAVAMRKIFKGCGPEIETRLLSFF